MADIADGHAAGKTKCRRMCESDAFLCAIQTEGFSPHAGHPGRLMAEGTLKVVTGRVQNFAAAAFIEFPIPLKGAGRCFASIIKGIA